MKIIAENNSYKLAYMPGRANRYVVYETVPVSPSGELKLDVAKAQSPILSKKIRSYFTKSQIDSAKAKVHGMSYANRRFKA